MNLISASLNKTPLYRLTLIGLSLIAFVAIVYGFLHPIPYTGVAFIISLFVLFTSCYFTNIILAKLFNLPYKFESAMITALILFFIFSPSTQTETLLTLAFAGSLAIVLKYVLAIQKKNVFNPAAIAAVIIGLTGVNSASWWIATGPMMWFVAIVGFVIVRRMGKLPMLGIFLFTALISIILFNISLFRLNFIGEVFQSWPLFFLGAFMLTEPKTTPPGKNLQFIYAVVIGILFGAHFQIGPIYATPEIAIVGGNIVSFVLRSVKLKSAV